MILLWTFQTFKNASEASAPTGKLGHSAMMTSMKVPGSGDAVAALEACAPNLKPGALVVLAIKLTQPAKSTALNDKRAEPYVERLRPLLDDAAAHHLVASRTRERTVVGRWRGS